MDASFVRAPRPPPRPPPASRARRRPESHRSAANRRFETRRRRRRRPGAVANAADKLRKRHLLPKVRGQNRVQESEALGPRVLREQKLAGDEGAQLGAIQHRSRALSRPERPAGSRRARDGGPKRRQRSSALFLRPREERRERVRGRYARPTSTPEYPRRTPRDRSGGGGGRKRRRRVILERRVRSSKITRVGVGVVVRVVRFRIRIVGRKRSRARPLLSQNLRPDASVVRVGVAKFRPERRARRERRRQVLLGFPARPRREGRRGRSGGRVLEPQREVRRRALDFERGHHRGPRERRHPRAFGPGRRFRFSRVFVSALRIRVPETTGRSVPRGFVRPPGLGADLPRQKLGRALRLRHRREDARTSRRVDPGSLARVDGGRLYTSDAADD